METKLVRPNIELRESFLQGLRESHQEGKFLFWNYETVSTDFPAFVKNLREKEVLCPIAKVPESMFWALNEGQYVGRISIRHSLTEELKTRGGHIGYDVRPSFRQLGFGSEILNLGLKEAGLIGLSKVLLTTDDTNLASWKVIEKNGGVLEKTSTPPHSDIPLRYYWINIG